MVKTSSRQENAGVRSRRQGQFVQVMHRLSRNKLAIPSTDIHHPHERIHLKGEITSSIDPKPGCRFAARCPYACERCHQPQELTELAPNHFVSCCRAAELNGLA